MTHIRVIKEGIVCILNVSSIKDEEELIHCLKKTLKSSAIGNKGNSNKNIAKTIPPPDQQVQQTGGLVSDEDDDKSSSSSSSSSTHSNTFETINLPSTSTHSLPRPIRSSPDDPKRRSLSLKRIRNKLSTIKKSTTSSIKSSSKGKRFRQVKSVPSTLSRHLRNIRYGTWTADQRKFHEQNKLLAMSSSSWLRVKMTLSQIQEPSTEIKYFALDFRFPNSSIEMRVSCLCPPFGLKEVHRTNPLEVTLDSLTDLKDTTFVVRGGGSLHDAKTDKKEARLVDITEGPPSTLPIRLGPSRLPSFELLVRVTGQDEDNLVEEWVDAITKSMVDCQKESTNDDDGLYHHQIKGKLITNLLDDDDRQPEITDSKELAEPETEVKSSSPKNTQVASVFSTIFNPYPWFHGKISRSYASRLVTCLHSEQNSEWQEGIFLVRESETREGQLVLTFNAGERAKHLRIQVTLDTIDQETRVSGVKVQHLYFGDLTSLLEYFQGHSIPLEHPTHPLSTVGCGDVTLTDYVVRTKSLRIPDHPQYTANPSVIGRLKKHIRRKTGKVEVEAMKEIEEVFTFGGSVRMTIDEVEELFRLNNFYS